MLNDAIIAANKAVHTAGQAPEHKSMGTTLVAACVRDARLYIANVGDSRAYLIQQQSCMQITVDHSYLNELVRTGVVAIEDAPRVDLKGMSSVITRAIGVAETVEPDFFSAELTPGSIVLLTSDGLTRYVDHKELSQLLGTGDIQAAAQTLVDLAKERGGHDNVTVLLLHVTVNTPQIVNAQNYSA